MSQLIRSDDPRLTWQGTISLQHTEEWVMPWRIPYETCNLFAPDALQERAAMPAGARLAFHSNTDLVAGELEPPPEAAKLDLCCNGDLLDSVGIAGHDRFRFEGLPAGNKLIELWLPQYGVFRLRSLELSDDATITPFEDTRPRWITYGSSITQCRAAESPAYTWPAIVARKRGLNLTCLGYGGQCHLDSMIARMIRELPADFISICVGINIQGAGSLNTRTFRPGIIGFVEIIREKQPEVPFAVISPIYSAPRETTPNRVGFSLQMMREKVAAAVDTLQEHGDANIHYIDGLDLFGPKFTHLLPDELHPNAEGYRVMGKNFLRQVIDRVFP